MDKKGAQHWREKKDKKEYLFAPFEEVSFEAEEILLQRKDFSVSNNYKDFQFWCFKKKILTPGRWQLKYQNCDTVWKALDIDINGKYLLHSTSTGTFSFH